MDRSSEKGKSSRKHRDSDDKDRDSKHRREADDNYDDGSRRHHRSSKHRDADDRHRSEKSYDREDSVERRYSSTQSHKRKERLESEDRNDGKRVKGSEERKRRFEEENGRDREEKRERRRFDDGEGKAKEERKERKRFEDKGKDNREVDEEKRVRGPLDKAAKKESRDEVIDSDQNGGGSIANGDVMESLSKTIRTFPEGSFAPDSSATKVSSIPTTNENKGVSINRSHEVHGKSSTDGTTADAAKSGGLSLNALAKAKRALQMQKELAEKLKKIPQLNKSSDSSKEGSLQGGIKEDLQASSSGFGTLTVSGLSSSSGILPTPPGSMPSTSTLQTAASSVVPPPSGLPHIAGLTAQKYEAVKRAQELAVKMGFRQDPEFAPLINMFPGQMAPEVTIQPKPPKAPVLRLDALGREIDEHGNVVNMPKLNTLSTLKVNINKQKKDAFQILKPELEVDPDKNPHFDPRMGINKSKLLRPKRMTFEFVEEGKWSKEAETIKLKSQFGEAQAKELKAKQAQLAKAKAEPDINPNLIEVSERVIMKEKPKEPIPDIEWWDAALLQSGTYGDIIDGTLGEDKLKMEKMTIYVEHPRPIEPPAEPAPPSPQPLKLTKKEQKKLRTQRRLAREKDRQEMIKQGLIEPPKPKVKMSNLMKVLGSEATQDPTKLEMEIRSAAAEREQAHIDRNIARKLTPEEKREKKERKLFDDPNTSETIVSVYKINELSHPQTRFKVDVNAQENRLSGCAVISDGISVVVVEGGIKSIKRYNKLMLRRIDWAAAVKNEEEEEEEEEKPINKCVLVWQGSVAKPSFNRFGVHECRTAAAARKVFSDAGVPHYWDLAVNFTEEQI